MFANNKACGKICFALVKKNYSPDKVLKIVPYLMESLKYEVYIHVAHVIHHLSKTRGEYAEKAIALAESFSLRQRAFLLGIALSLFGIKYLRIKTVDS